MMKITTGLAGLLLSEEPHVVPSCAGANMTMQTTNMAAMATAFKHIEDN